MYTFFGHGQTILSTKMYGRAPLYPNCWVCINFALIIFVYLGLRGSFGSHPLCEDFHKYLSSLEYTRLVKFAFTTDFVKLTDVKFTLHNLFWKIELSIYSLWASWPEFHASRGIWCPTHLSLVSASKNGPNKRFRIAYILIRGVSQYRLLGHFIRVAWLRQKISRISLGSEVLGHPNAHPDLIWVLFSILK